MTFAQIAAQQAVFLDANTLVYHLQPHPLHGGSCNRLLERIEQDDLEGFTSTHVLSEVAHRLMMMEASALPGWGGANVRLRIQKHPAVVQGLKHFRAAIASVLQSKVQVLVVSAAQVLVAADISTQTGLLSNDALLVALMQHHGLTALASNDADFDRVPGIVRYGPA